MPDIYNNYQHNAKTSASSISASKTTTNSTISEAKATSVYATELTFIDTAYMGSIVFFLVNFVCMFYVWFRKSFARMEFWVLYGFNVLWSILLIL